MLSKFKKTYFYEIISEVYMNLHFAYWENFLFESIYKLLSIIIFIPFISFIFNWLLSLSNFKALTNSQLIRFAFSKYGFLTFLLLVPISITLIFIEISVLIIISYYSMNRKKINLFSAIKKSISYLPVVFGFGILQLTLYLLLLLPLFSVGVNSSLIPSLSIPNFVSGELLKTNSGTLLYLSLIALIIYLNIRWIYSFHVIIIGGEKNFKKASKISSRIIKNHYLKTLLLIVFSILFFILIIIILGTLISLVLLLPFYIIFSKSTVNIIFPLAILIIIILLFYFLTTIINPIAINILTKLYLDYCKKNNIHIVGIKANKIDEYQSFTVKHKKLILSVIIPIFVITSTGTFFMNSALVQSINEKFNNMAIMAHRGDINFGVENTIGAIEGAIKEQANYAEIDVQQTKDGILVLTHDTNLKRLTGENVNIYNLTLKEAKQLTLHENGFTGKIPTLEEVLKYCDGKIKLNIEMKINGHEKDYVNKLINLLNEYKYVNKCVIQSTDYNVLMEFKKQAPKFKVGYIVLAGFPKAEFIDTDFLAVEESLVNEKLISKCNILNKKIYVWTVNKDYSMEEFYLMGVDGIITDYPKIAKETLDELKNVQYEIEYNDFFK